MQAKKGDPNACHGMSWCMWHDRLSHPLFFFFNHTSSSLSSLSHSSSFPFSLKVAFSFFSHSSFTHTHTHTDDMENTTPPQDTVGASASSPPKRTLTSMPTEVLMAIALALPCKDFASVLQTCRTIHGVLNTHYIWHQRFITRFGQTALLQQLNSSNKDDAAAASASSSGASSRASTAPSSPRFPPNSILGAGSSSSGATASGYGNILPLPFIEHYHNHQDPNSTTSSPQLSSSGAPSPSPSGYSSPHSEHAGSGSGASSESDEGNDNTDDGPKDKDKDKEDGNAKSRAKGKGRKVDLRKTNKASKELLIELYKQYCTYSPSSTVHTLVYFTAIVGTLEDGQSFFCAGTRMCRCSVCHFAPQKLFLS